ncbi:MAG: PAS domain S-box protein [Deltaproteobacteria bacterium]|nr:PAS domain S-box protein [Deltaproteobacteria bacterium]
MSHEDLGLMWLDQLERSSAEEGGSKQGWLESLVLFLFEMGNNGILVLDEDFRVEYANQLASEMTGMERWRLIGAQFPSLLNEADRQSWFRLHERLCKASDDYPRRCALLMLESPAGTIREAEVCIGSHRTPQGPKLFVQLSDQTEHLRILNEVRKSNTFLSNIIRSSVDGILGADTKGSVLIFNEGAEQLLGYRADEVVGKMHIEKIYATPEMAREVMSKIRSDEYGGKGKLTTIQVRLRDRSGEEIPCNLSAAMIYEDGEEVATVGIFTDLRERLRMERELEETHLQLVQSEKMASLGKLAAGVAHEINNPLGGILMYASLLLEGMDDDMRKGDLQHIVDQTLRCKEIVQNLLDFSRQSGKERTRFSLNESIHKVVSLFKNQSLFHNIRVSMDLDPRLPPTEGDPGLMNQVITNLVVNAVDAMEGEGTLSLRSYYDKERSMIVAEIEDTGSGISEEHLPRIFDPFFTTKRVGKGTGLGLSTAYGIVRRHGGNLSAKSRLGEGATFRVELPVSNSERQ